MGSKICGIKWGKPKHALQNFEVIGSVLTEKMHTMENKSIQGDGLDRMGTQILQKEEAFFSIHVLGTH